MNDENERNYEADPDRFAPEAPVNAPAEETAAGSVPAQGGQSVPGSGSYHQSYRDVPHVSESFRPASSPRYEEPQRPRYREAPEPQIPYQPPYTDNVYREEPRKPKRERKKGWTAGRVIALALVCALLGGVFGLGGSLLVMSRQQKKAAERDPMQHSLILEGDRPRAVLDRARIGTGERLTASQVYAENVNSTVGITTSITTNYWGFQTTSAASGSGFILTSDGYVLTNYHVVEDSSSVKVACFDGSSYDAVIVGCDAENDIAVLKVEAEDLIPVVLGSSDALTVGEDVLAIGNPLGELTFSLTSGVVSALDRTVTFSNGTSMKLIQTDCAINSGNSGGALFNMYGEVVGITNAKYGSSSSSASIDNICFAIPIDSVRSVVDSIIEKGMIIRPYIGLSCGTVSSEMQSYGFPKGAVIKELREDSPALQAGLQINDIVTAANGKEISGSSDLVEFIGDSTPGDTVTFTVFRQGEDDLLTISVTVGEQQESAVVATQSDTAQQPQQQQPYDPFEYFFRNPFGFGF